MFSSRSVQIAAVFSDVFGQALPNLCRSFYNETKAEMFFSVFAVALLAEGVDRNYDNKSDHTYTVASPSSRRAWIEICSRAERCRAKRVALLAEGVDRNPKRGAHYAKRRVALLAEGVDRNTAAQSMEFACEQSPSSRRAWIEITAPSSRTRCAPVALLAEGVDRNIRTYIQYVDGPVVALLAEGVDRNICAASSTLTSSVALLAEGVDRNRFPSGFHRAGHVALLAEGVDRNSR